MNVMILPIFYNESVVWSLENVVICRQLLYLIFRGEIFHLSLGYQV